MNGSAQRTCLEFYCGIGGFAEAASALAGNASPGETGSGAVWDVVAAIDIDRAVLGVYALRFPTHRRLAAEIESVDLTRLRADVWWLSPSCLPFTRKGKQQDLQDLRTRSLVSLIGQVRPGAEMPRRIMIENVPPFSTSMTGRWVEQHLRCVGFDVVWEFLCPTQWGVPMRRLRTYLLASLDPLAPRPPVIHQPSELRDYVNAANDSDARLRVPDEWLRRYPRAIDLVDRDSPTVIASCFTSSYSRMPVRSGSFLRLEDGGARFFAPDEILHLLGFSMPFSWPETVSLKRRWAMAGNSLSIPVVRWLLSRP